jgi:hypothetical protein
VVVAKKAKRASKMSGEGLTLGRVKKNKMIIRMSNIERVEAVRTCSSCGARVDVGMEDELVDEIDESRTRRDADVQLHITPREFQICSALRPLPSSDEQR